ncbi:MAG: ATP-binding cassette domain-containing protein [Clostridiales bacterium]|nr:ATP-binding cassette domain-containing protein [Clostridiales bacterium]
MEIFNIQNLSFSYPDREPCLSDINFSVKQGEFIVVCGESGCGKTTLLKLLKPQISPFGKTSGEIKYLGKPLSKTFEEVTATEIGFVFQNPDNQIVTDKVYHELAFGLESMGVDTNTIKRKTAEMASFFGIEQWFRQSTDSLSGGQKQLLNLASVLVMSPKVIILDEPTSQLDPVASSEFILTLKRLNEQLGLTVIIVEHRLEEIFPIADRVIAMENGKILSIDTPKAVCKSLLGLPMELALPSATRIFSKVNGNGEIPVSVKEGRAFINENYKYKKSDEIVPLKSKKEITIRLKDVWYRYQKTTGDVLNGVDLEVNKGELYCLLGGNGTGKTTVLNVISGLSKAYKGSVIINNKKLKEYKNNSLYKGALGLLPQNPQSVFIKKTVEEDYKDLLKSIGISDDKISVTINEMLERLGISHLKSRHPLDISGGEQQKAALGKVLLTSPKILLLDEPTKGIDAFAKANLGRLLKELTSLGITVLAVTHDVEFAGEYADKCGLLFDGEVVSQDVPKRFFPQNRFYTTGSNLIASDVFPDCVTCQQVVVKCLEQQ